MATGTSAPNVETAVLHVGGLHYASEKAVVERVLSNRPGVVAVEANPVAQTATVTFDPSETGVAALRKWVEDCGYHCAGESVPGYLCDPLVAPRPYDDEAAERAEQAHGHGAGGHAGMSMEAMVRDMRNRFLAALAFTIPIVIWSPVGETVFGSMPAVPFGLDMELWQFVSRMPADATFVADLLGPSLVVAVGLAATFVALTVSAVEGIDDSESGLASGLINTSQQIGGALGLAVLTAVATGRTDAVAGDVAPAVALNEGFQAGLLVAAGFVVVAVVLTAVIGHGSRPARDQGELVTAAAVAPDAA